ncbi:3-demethylubiquinone-9 3-methyltransferase [uncultured archaeon]|nr:3-demethylubiquinone-9 3-methyltransferase [uncultured archaeon]
MQKITPFLWFDDKAEEAVKLYTSIFKNSKILNTARYDENSSNASGRPAGSVMTIAFELNGQTFNALNGGPIFKFTPAVSYFVYCDSEAQVNELWNKLLEGGSVLMEFTKYPFAEKYGWLNDKYGVSWQLFLGKTPQKINPCLMFIKENCGKATEAINFYTSVFKNAKTDFVYNYTQDSGEPETNVMHGGFTIEGQEFIIMDSGKDHEFNFTEANSFLINCENQEEVDYYWEKLTEGGSPSQCGWLKDKYGLSWQVVPTALSQLLSSKNSVKARNVMKAMLQMNKLDVNKLQEAYDQE